MAFDAPPSKPALPIPWPLLAAGVFMLSGCSGSSREVPKASIVAAASARPRPPSAVEVASAQPAAPEPASPCEKAALLRRRAPKLLDEGRLERTVRAIVRADELCPATKGETLAPLVTSLADLGRLSEAEALAREIEGSQGASGEAKEAAKKALTVIAQSSKAPIDGLMLVRQGVEARDAGDAARARRAFDRALYALEKKAGAPAVPDIGGDFVGPEAVAWSPDSSAIGVNDNIGVIVVFETGHFREIWRTNGAAYEIALLSPRTVARLGTAGSLMHGVAVSDPGAGRDFVCKLSEGVLARAIAGDGRTIAAGGPKGTVVVCREGEKRPRVDSKLHSAAITALALSRDGEAIVSASWSGGLCPGVEPCPSVGSKGPGAAGSGVKGTSLLLTNVSKGTSTTVIKELSYPATQLAIADDHRVIAYAAEDGAIWLLDATSGSEIALLAGTKPPIKGLAFRPDGKALAVINGEPEVRVWDLDAREVRQIIHGRVREDRGRGGIGLGRGVLAWSGAASQTARLFDFVECARGPLASDATCETLTTLRSPSKGPIYGGLFLSPDGSWMASKADGLRVWKRLSPSSVSPVPVRWHENGGVAALAPDGATLATGAQDIFLVGVSSGDMGPKKLQGHATSLSALAFGPDGRSLASADEGGTILVWSVVEPSPQPKTRIQSQGVGALAIMPDGVTLLSAHAPNTIRSWDLQTGALKSSITLKESFGDDPAFSPDGRVFAGSSEGKVQLFALPSGEPLGRVMSVTGHDAAYVVAKSGHIGLYGREAEAHLVCRVGEDALPFDVCKDRLYVPGLLWRLISGDQSYVVP